MANSKRERCINWELDEKQLLRNILRPYIKIIENKDLKTNTNKEKHKAWGEITEKFNLINLRKRERQQLINQWKTLKLASKKEMAQHRREINKTGGGPRPTSPSVETLEVAEMIPLEFCVDHNEFDCDGVPELPDERAAAEVQLQPSSSAMEILELPNEFNVSIVVESTGEQNHLDPECEGEEVPQAGTKRKHTKRETRKADSFNFARETFKDMHEYREREDERRQKEHEQRMAHMADAHMQLMLNLKLQYDTIKSNNNNNA